MALSKDFDSILNDFLQDYQNQLPDVDRAVGSMVFIKSAAISSQLWGLYKYQDFILRQIFPDSSITEYLERHAAARGLTRLAGETDAELLNRVLLHIRKPPAGGNQYDYVRWALEVSYDHTSYVEAVKGAWVYEGARGPGSINVVIISDRTTAFWEEVPTTELEGAVLDYINARRPLGIWDIDVIGAARLEPDVTMAVTGVSSEVKALIKTDIEDFIKTVEPGKTLFLAQLISLAIARGATNATLTLPASDVTVQSGPTVYERVWPGTVVVS